MKKPKAHTQLRRALTSLVGMTFVQVIELLHLDPSHDFCGEDLSGVDFGDADITGWDFTDANLAGANLLSVQNIGCATFERTELGDAILPLLHDNVVSEMLHEHVEPEDLQAHEMD